MSEVSGALGSADRMVTPLLLPSIEMLPLEDAEPPFSITVTDKVLGESVTGSPVATVIDDVLLVGAMDEEAEEGVATKEAVVEGAADAGTAEIGAAEAKATLAGAETATSEGLTGDT